MPIFTKTPNGWEAIAQDVKAVSSFGSIVPDGNQTDEGTYTDADGREWVWYEWDTAGDYSVSLTGGLYWVLAISGGGYHATSASYANQGSSGRVREGFWEFPANTSTPIQVGRNGKTLNVGGFSEKSFLGDFSTQAAVGYGTPIGGGADFSNKDNNPSTPYVSRITGIDGDYATDYRDARRRPGQGNSGGGLDPADGCVIIATVTNGAKPKPVQPALTPATVVSAPVKVSGTADVVEYIVRQTDGTRKKIYMLPGATGNIGGKQRPENVFEVTLGAGTLPGVMVGAGGTGGRTSQSKYPAGGGGAGGVIGTGAHQPVILPVQGTATYTITVGSTTIAPDVIQGQPTTLAVQGQTPFAAAVGGGRGLTIFSSYQVGARNGGSGGGGNGGTSPHIDIGEGIPGQGNRGGDANGHEYSPSGGGGGYGSEGGSNGDGGDGFNLKDCLNLDGSDAATSTFLAAVSVDGFIAGGGSGGGTVTAGGGVPLGDAENYTGAGGGGDTGTAMPGGNGGCGVVYIITDL